MRPATATANVEPSLKELAAKATTEREHIIVLNRLIKHREAVASRLAELDAGRAQAAIDGTSRDHSDERRRIGDEIKDLDAAIDEREALREAAQTREIEAAMYAGIEAARAKAPVVKALWLEWAGVLQQVRDTKARLLAEIRAMNDLQAHALRRMDQGDAALRQKVVPASRIRADAAAEVPRPTLGAEAASPMSVHDNIAVLSKLVVEEVNKLGVHMNDEHTAGRTGVIVDIRPDKTASGASIVDRVTATGERLPRGQGA